MRENMILNGKIKIKFLYGNAIPFRLRVDEHALDRMAQRQKEGDTKMAIINRLVAQVSRKEMMKHPLPQDGDKPIYFLEDTQEVFLCMIRKPTGTVENVNYDLIVSSYMVKKEKEIVAHYHRNECVSFRTDNTIEVGANEFFRRVC